MNKYIWRILKKNNFSGFRRPPCNNHQCFMFGFNGDKLVYIMIYILNLAIVKFIFGILYVIILNMYRYLIVIFPKNTVCIYELYFVEPRKTNK